MNLQEILTELKALNVSELIDLYLEAKTGKNGLIGDLPFIDGIDPISNLQESIDELLNSLD
jgi:hypothetical protein